MLTDRLRRDLTAAMRARDELRTATLRMVLTAVQTEQVSGTSARDLTDGETEAVLAREAKKRREAAQAFADAGRPELAARERAEGDVISGYLPTQLSDAELAEVVAEALTDAGLVAPGPDSTGPGSTVQRSFGQAMKAANAKVAGRAEGGRVAAEVRRQVG